MRLEEIGLRNPVLFRTPDGGEGGRVARSGGDVEIRDLAALREALGLERIQTVFSPGDGPLRMELACFDAIIQARKADPNQYPPDQNPYRIIYAIYNMTDPKVIAKLAEAMQLGIAVQVLIDSHQIAPNKPWNTVVDDLKRRGFSHAESQRGLTEEQRRDTNIIEIDMGRGLFHLKSRYFTFPDPVTREQREVLLTGSHNPQESAHENDESLHQINEPRLIRKYLSAITALRDEKPIVNTWDQEEATNVLFTSPTAQGPHPIDKIFDLVRAENEMIFLSVFTLRNIIEQDTRRKLVDELKAAKERGAKVVVVTDHKQADGVDIHGNPRPDSSNDDTDDLLKAAGIPTYEVTNRAGDFNAMHLKSAIFGLTDMKIVTDAGNWTFATMGSTRYRSKNAESILFMDSRMLDGNTTGYRYLGKFLQVLRKYDGQNADQPKAEELLADLMSHPAWPRVKLRFDVLARTHWGQEVYVVGNGILRDWNTENGIKLGTDAESYPEWRANPIEVPLGARFEYKVVKRNARGEIDWEPGTNAILVVDPTSAPDPALIRVGDAFNGD
jgi:hypothetical protein